MNRQRGQQIFSGLALIVLGVALYALKYYDNMGRSAIFFLVGGAFLAGYFFRREFGYLVPGCLLTGMGVGSLGHRSFFADARWTMLGLGLGFVGVAVIGLAYERKFRGWPLIPGAVLILLGIPNTQEVVHYFFEHWPLLLIIVGVLVLLGALRPGIRRESSD